MTDNARLGSLDAFRGFTIAAMVLVNNPGDWGHVHAPLVHAKWHGWTFTDVIFPFFLFIVGVSMVISTQRALGNEIESAPKVRFAVLRRLWLRCGFIVLIGFAMNLVPQFDFSTVRVPGVLQRIGLASAIAAPVVVLGGVRGLIGLMIACFVLYAGLMLYVPVPDATGAVAAGVLEAGRDFGAFVDRAVFGNHVWRSAKTWDPEGLVSTLPAVGNVLTGALLAHGLRASRVDDVTKIVWIMTAGVCAISLGEFLGHVLMPVNKNLWTVSYSVLMSGWALLVFGVFFWLMDVWPNVCARVEARRVLQPFTIYGMNALFIFVLSGLIGRLLVFTKIEGVSLKAYVFAPLKALPLVPQASSLLYAIAFNGVMFLVAWLMWRKKWFVKI